MQTVTPDEIREFFLSLIGEGKRFESSIAMAKSLGLTRSKASTFYCFLKGAKTQYQLVIEWFLNLGGQIALPDERMEEYAFVPRVKAVAGCGSSFETDDAVAGLYAFRKEFLERIHVKADKAVMMYVRGDSMEPVISDGDTVMVDKTDTSAREGYMYLVGFEDDLMVKRLQRTPRGWKICSVNPNYPPVPVEGDDLDTFRVYGRVRWIGRVV